MGVLPLQLLYILPLQQLLMHCRSVAGLKSLLIRLSLLSRSLLHTAATTAAHAIAILRPCHLLKLMTPGQIILPPFWLHVWECVLKSGSIPSISPPVTGTGDLSDDDFLYFRSDDPGSWRPPMTPGSCQPSNCRPPGSPCRCPKRKPTYDPWKPQTFELNQATGNLL